MMTSGHTHTHTGHADAKKRRRRSLARRSVGVDFSVSRVYTHTHTCTRTRDGVKAEEHAYVKCPRAAVRIAQGGPRWRHHRRCCRCRRRSLTIGDSPGSAAASSPPPSLPRPHCHRVHLYAVYKFPPHSYRHKLGPCTRHHNTVMSSGGWWRTRAPVTYIVNFYQPPLAGHPHRSGRRRRGGVTHPHSRA